MAEKKSTKKAVKAPAKAAKAGAKGSSGASAKAKPAAAKAPVRAEVKSPAAEIKKPQAEIKRVPPRIIRKPAPAPKVQTETYREIDTKAAVAFASSIAQEMKRSAAEADQNRLRDEIQLSRRPTTRAQGCNTEKFPESALKEFRKRLIDARENALKGVDAMKATGFNESEDRRRRRNQSDSSSAGARAYGQHPSHHSADRRGSAPH